MSLACKGCKLCSAGPVKTDLKEYVNESLHVLFTLPGPLGFIGVAAKALSIRLSKVILVADVHVMQARVGMHDRVRIDKISTGDRVHI